MADEAVDCHIIELLREEVLPFPKEVSYKLTSQRHLCTLAVEDFFSEFWHL